MRYTYKCSLCETVEDRTVKIAERDKPQPCEKAKDDTTCQGSMLRAPELEVIADMSHQWAGR